MEEDGDAGPGEVGVVSVEMAVGFLSWSKLKGRDDSSMTVLVILSAKRTDLRVAGATVVEPVGS